MSGQKKLDVSLSKMERWQCRRGSLRGEPTKQTLSKRSNIHESSGLGLSLKVRQKDRWSKLSLAVDWSLAPFVANQSTTTAFLCALKVPFNPQPLTATTTHMHPYVSISNELLCSLHNSIHVHTTRGTNQIRRDRPLGRKPISTF
ncbi:hypothetical protein PVK06_024109 [Gossypium arboreum]|uniref:Uncharacterized protein n=1 Tax=Gossypium arboreum TaxID=29729 RepID=A0ABR0PDA9_GOSAR|nr:hypothetical protein PVK06_024109 [Gossypium arboreum]